MGRSKGSKKNHLELEDLGREAGRDLRRQGRRSIRGSIPAIPGLGWRRKTASGLGMGEWRLRRRREVAVFSLFLTSKCDARLANVSNANIEVTLIVS
jgi:hypothetical protein